MLLSQTTPIPLAALVEAETSSQSGGVGSWLQAHSVDLLIKAGIVLACAIVAMVLSRIATRLINRVFEGKTLGNVSLITNAASVAIWGFMIAVAAKWAFGVELSGILAALGIGSVCVSVGMQDLIKNIVAGVQIITSKVYSVGDNVVMGDKRGEVVDIAWRQTVLIDPDGDPVIVPNSLINTTMLLRRENAMSNRYEFDVEVRPGLDLDRVAADMEASAYEALAGVGSMAEGQKPQVRFLGSTAYGIQASVRMYLNDATKRVPSIDACMRAFSRKGYLSDANAQPVTHPWEAEA